jgi:3-deoxy-D-manno-octulosonic-acid transferase
MSFRGNILLKIYQIFSVIILPFLFILILWRKKKFKEHPHRFLERLAITKIVKPQNSQLFWVHAVSVGESNSAWVLIENLLKFSEKITILFTSTSTTSAQIIEQKILQNELFKNRVIHQFLPIDSYFIVKKFLNYWKPRACIFVESEIWPNFIYCARKKAILSFLINARISKKTASKWLFLKKLGFNIFDYFSTIFAQSAQDKNLLQNLTKNTIFYEGNLKSQNPKLEIDATKLQELKMQIGARKIWLCASTHEGEEELILQTHQRLKKQFSDLLTIIVLRHPNRADKVCELFKNINFSQRSKNQNIFESTEIYLVDSLGELGTFYSLTNFAFIGGSLLKIGGHNPFEAIQLNCVVITGSEVFNFAEIYSDLHQRNACEIVKNVDELYEIIKKFLENPNDILSYNNNAKKAIEVSQNISQKIIKKLDEILMLGV